MRILLCAFVFAFSAHAVQFNKIEFQAEVEKIANQLDEKKAQELRDYSETILNKLDQLETQPEAKKQKFLGRIFSKVGLFMGKVHMITTKPFANISGWITGFFEKKFGRSNEKRKIPAMANAYLESIEEGAEDDPVIQSYINRIKNGKPITAGEMRKLFELAPKYRMRFHEKILTYATRYTVPILLFAIIKKSLWKVPGIALAVIDGAFLISYIPCMKFPIQNDNLRKYCHEMEDNYILEVQLSRVKGYLKGVNKKNKKKEKKRKNKEARASRQDIAQSESLQSI